MAELTFWIFGMAIWAIYLLFAGAALLATTTVAILGYGICRAVRRRGAQLP